jgi:hypothetical protein
MGDFELAAQPSKIKKIKQAATALNSFFITLNL